MAILSVNTYNAVAENTYATQKKQVSEKEKTKNTTTAKESKINTDEYVRKLQKQVKDLSLEVGTGLNTKKDNMVGAVTINPKLLKKCKMIRKPKGNIHKCYKVFRELKVL